MQWDGERKHYIYEMSPLKIYKASAGSGKTYALTLEYLSLLFRYPDAHRHILAVTFTNKAAGEMKKRILDRLNTLSKSSVADRSDELKHLINETGLEPGLIIQRAGILLNAILNDYSSFSVGTIDKFFQSVIRAFTREIGIQPGYNLELDTTRVLSQGVDQLFKDISDHPALQSWLIRYAEERMEDSRSWNFRGDVIELGMQLFRESFQEMFTDFDLSLLNRENLKDFQDDLYSCERTTHLEIQTLGKSALDHIANQDLKVESFKGGGRSPAVLFNIAANEGEVSFTDAKLEAMEQADKWLKKDAGPGMISLTEGILMPLLAEIYQKQVILNTIGAIRQNFYNLGILGDLMEKVQEYLKEHNLFLITDSSRFLRGIVGGGQVPFIYERTGNRFSNIMLDEFQDTSVFQYDNFKPLLDNALASGFDNLVVGDVKQSIYRWRNSDWKILAADLEKDFAHQEISKKTLSYNYRSREQVIRFNNTVFQLAPRRLAEVVASELDKAGTNRKAAEEAIFRFRDAYADAVQQFPPGMERSGGMVRIGFFTEEPDHSFRDQALAALPAWIEDIQKSGIEPGEIAILVRTRKEGVMVAGKLLEHARVSGESHKFRLISSESLLLAHNDAVTLLISALYYLVYPDDKLNNALLKYRSRQAGKDSTGTGEGLFDASLPVDPWLPPEFVSGIPLLRQMPLFELVETLISIFGLQGQVFDLPYIQAFQELVIDLQRRESRGISDFLLFWEEKGFQKGIQVSENSNAIRILTIHRSKGLEFRAVLIPFCNWEITTDQRKSNILWCETAGTPFNRVPTVPVKFTGDMKHTHFSEYYYQERMKGFLDSLNLMYVAFTRAVDVLCLGVPERKDEKLKNMGDLLIEIMEMHPELPPALEPMSTYRKGNELIIGSLHSFEKQEREKDPWQFKTYMTNPGNRMLRLRMRSDSYFVDEEGVFRTDRVFGNVMHMVFSRIEYIDDLDTVLNGLLREGVLSIRDRPEIRERILEMISGEGVMEWFRKTDGRAVYNERSIMDRKGKIYRPDRVMLDGDHVRVVDFKFGKGESEKYHTQVWQYINLLKEMGYSRVEGFIWYASLGKIIQIEPS